MNAKRIITRIVAVLTIAILVALNSGFRGVLADIMHVDIALLGVVIPAYMLLIGTALFGIGFITKGLNLRAHA